MAARFESHVENDAHFTPNTLTRWEGKTFWTKVWHRRLLRQFAFDRAEGTAGLAPKKKLLNI